MVGEKLLAAGLITQAQLDEALAKAKETGGRVGDVAVELGFVTREQVESVFN
jgi:hypothetical protein